MPHYRASWHGLQKARRKLGGSQEEAKRKPGGSQQEASRKPAGSQEEARRKLLEWTSHRVWHGDRPQVLDGALNPAA
jgi:hypothetical protein